MLSLNTDRRQLTFWYTIAMLQTKILWSVKARKEWIPENCSKVYIYLIFRMIIVPLSFKARENMCNCNIERIFMLHANDLWVVIIKFYTIIYIISILYLFVTNVALIDGIIRKRLKNSYRFCTFFWLSLI